MHIPKTGGTWVYDALPAAGVQLEQATANPHATLAEVDRGGRFTFAFVREPLPWYRSLWKFHRRDPQYDWLHVGQFLDLDLPDFIRAMGHHHPGYLAHYYEGFVGTPDDEIDFVGHHENLREDLIRALRLSGQDFDEAVLRRYPARNYDGELELRDSRPLLPPPSSLPVPDEVAQFIASAERGLYERFYYGSVVE